MSFFLRLACTCEETYEPFGPQRKSLRKFNLCSLATTCRSVWPRLKNRKTSPTIRHKYKYFHSTVQGAKDRQLKFHFCRLPFDVRPRNVKLNLSNIYTFPLMSVLKILQYKQAMNISHEPSATALLGKHQSEVLTEKTKLTKGQERSQLYLL